MVIENLVVKQNKQIAENIFLIQFISEKISSLSKPGQFCNIRIFAGTSPLLRRPFSISDVKDNIISFMYKVVGTGTKLLAGKKEGDIVDVLGPLGHGFNVEDNYNHAVIIAGGIGIAPFPYLIKSLPEKVSYSVLLGVRNKSEIPEYNFNNLKISTDDGTTGIKGNVINLLEVELGKLKNKKVKLFACGPTPMTKALQSYVKKNNLLCEVSLETEMACGIGVCQACIVEVDKAKPYKLICKHGPVFNINEIIL